MDFSSAALKNAAGWSEGNQTGTGGLYPTFLSESAILMNKFILLSTKTLNYKFFFLIYTNLLVDSLATSDNLSFSDLFCNLDIQSALGE